MGEPNTRARREGCKRLLLGAALGLATLPVGARPVAAQPSAALSSSPTVAGLPRRLLADVETLWQPRAAWVLVGGAAVTGLAFAVEDAQGTAEFLDGGVIDPLADAGNTYGSLLVLVPAAAGLWALGHASDRPQLAWAGSEALEALALTNLVVGILKPTVDRTRPDGLRYSFPSGHTASALAVAPVVTRRLGWKLGVAAYAASVLVALGRLEELRHHLSDVTAGATLGLLMGTAVAYRDTGAGLLGHLRAMPGGVALTFSY